MDLLREYAVQAYAYKYSLHYELCQVVKTGTRSESYGPSLSESTTGSGQCARTCLEPVDHVGLGGGREGVRPEEGLEDGPAAGAGARRTGDFERRF